MTKITNFRDSLYAFYNDDPISYDQEQEHCLTIILTFMRAIGRILYFVLVSLILVILFAILVKPAKLRAVVETHSKDLTKLIGKNDL